MNKTVFYKICTLFRFAVFLFLWMAAYPAAAQPRDLVTLDKQQVPIEEIMREIEKQTGYVFLNKDADVRQVVSLKVEEQPVPKVLDLLFADREIAFEIKSKHIVLFKRPQQASAPAMVEGQVVDAAGSPVIGAAVTVKGTTVGVSTDVEGRYRLEIPAMSGSAVLLVNYLGYESQEIPVNRRTTIDITLRESALNVDAVVVTALGIKRSEKALSYNVQEVDGESILGVKDVNFINSLNGRVAGVTINAGSSGIGGASKVVMRGTKGIDQSSNALYVIDGVPMYNMMSSGATGAMASEGTTEPIADLNPEDIESMSVLTGAAAAALYGSHASNGAIIITTKKGKAGNTSVTVSSNTEFVRAFRLPEFQNSYGTGDLLSDVESVERSWGRKLTDAEQTGYDPGEDFLKTGYIQTEAVSLSTGTERNQTYFSASAVNAEGIVPNNGYDRYNVTFRNTTSFAKDRMTLDVGGSYIKQTDMNMINQGTYLNPLVTAYLLPRSTDWDAIRMYERYDSERKIMTQYWEQGIAEYNGQNPYWVCHRNLRETKRNRYMANASLKYDILDWLNVVGRVRIDNTVSNSTKKLYASTNRTITNGSENGFYGYTHAEESQTYADVIVNINKTMGQWSLTANAGASLSDMRQKSRKIEGGIADDLIPNLFNEYQIDLDNVRREQTDWVEQTQSVFASAELGWNNAVFLTLTGRSDWPSQLAGPYSTQKSFFYPSAGLSVVLSELVRMPEQISYLKFRTSYASVGMPFARFLANPTYAWDEGSKSWIQQTHYPMSELKPERTRSFEVGVTMRFLKHFNLDLSYYNARTFNQTFDPKISVSSGYSTLYVQTGNVQNQGVELSLGYSNSWGGEQGFSWSSSYTLGCNRNEILELVEDYRHPETGEFINMDRFDISSLNQVHFILKKGGSLGDIYSLQDLVRDHKGGIYIDNTGNVAINNNAGDIKLGSVFPKANMAWRNDFSWRRISMGMTVSARLGGVVYSATQAAMDQFGVSKATADARDRGYVLVNNEKVDPEKWYTTISKSGGLPQYYTYDATNVRLSELSFGYTIPFKLLAKRASVTVSFIGRNLWMIYCKAPFDPENVASTGNYYQGMDNFMMPSTRNLGFSVRLKF